MVFSIHSAMTHFGVKCRLFNFWVIRNLFSKLFFSYIAEDWINVPNWVRKKKMLSSTEVENPFYSADTKEIHTKKRRTVLLFCPKCTAILSEWTVDGERWSAFIVITHFDKYPKPLQICWGSVSPIIHYNRLNLTIIATNYK